MISPSALGNYAVRRTRFERMHCVQTFAVTWVPHASMRTGCRLGNQRRLVLFIAWLTLFPAIGPLPQMSQRFAISSLPRTTRRLYHGFPGGATPCGVIMCCLLALVGYPGGEGWTLLFGKDAFAHAGLRPGTDVRGNAREDLGGSSIERISGRRSRSSGDLRCTKIHKGRCLDGYDVWKFALSRPDRKAFVRVRDRLKNPRRCRAARRCAPSQTR
jgi:hypothetical protein